MMLMPNSLHEVEVVEVSLVDKAANKRKFLVTKSDKGGHTMTDELVLNVENEEVANVLKSITEMDGDKIAAIKSLSELDQDTLATLMKYESDDEDLTAAIQKAGISDKAQKAVKVALQALSAVKDELGGDIMKKLAAAGGFPFPAGDKKKPEEDDKMTEKQKTQKSAEGGDVMALVKKDADGNADFSDVPENVRPLVAQLWKQNEEAIRKAEETETILKQERDQRVLKEFIQKAEGFQHLGVEPTKFGAILKACKESLDESMFTELERVLKTADEKMAPLFKELGTGGEGDDDQSAYAQLEKKAQEIRKSEGSLSFEQAFVKAVDQNPDLAQKEREERNSTH
jgi:hypothetical protein